MIYYQEHRNYAINTLVTLTLLQCMYTHKNGFIVSTKVSWNDQSLTGKSENQPNFGFADQSLVDSTE